MSLSNWNPYDDYVQGGMVDGRFQNAAYTMLAAGPPRLANVGGATVLGGTLQGGGAAGDQIAFPMGLIQNFNMGHNMNLTRVFELGSHRSYFIPGRTVGQLQFKLRVFVDGDAGPNGVFVLNNAQLLTA